MAGAGEKGGLRNGVRSNRVRLCRQCQPPGVVEERSLELVNIITSHNRWCVESYPEALVYRSRQFRKPNASVAILLNHKVASVSALLPQRNR
jgi:hypothetical protein